MTTSPHPILSSLVNLDDYDVSPRIEGSGTTGTVYLARLKGSVGDYDLAVKYVWPTEPLKGEIGEIDEDTARYRTYLTLRGISLHYLCTHPSLVSLRGWNINVSDGCISLILRRVSGRSLSDGLSRLTPSQKRIILYGITCGVKYLHDNQMIHRDLKCENILLDERSYPFIIDFGSAKLCLKQCQTGPMGSLLYQAPEIYDSANYGFPADIYSLAITFWEVLRGTPWEPPVTDSRFNEGIISGKLRPHNEGEVNKLTDLQLELLTNMWHHNPGERWPISKVLDHLKMSDMWEESTTSEFDRYLQWYGTQPQVNVDLKRVGQASEAVDLDKLLEPTDPGLGFSGYIADIIGMFTGKGDDVNMEMRQKVLRQLENNRSLDHGGF
jgi:serine/threonine protein kinase